MGKGKLAKFADMARMEHVFEFPIKYTKHDTGQNDNTSASPQGEGWGGVVCPLRGHWHEQVFHNDNPIVLELGCGRGEYTVGLARLHPNMNFIGVDIKGARMWTGARQAEEEGLKNVAFLRTNIEIIDQFFTAGEVAEIWLTFSDPQMKKVTKRLTSTSFIHRYRRFVREDGIIHVKTDSNFLFTYTEEMLRANGIDPIISTRNLYDDSQQSHAECVPQAETTQREAIVPDKNCQLLNAARAIQTYYEGMWMNRGIPIKYLAFALAAEPAELIEPNVEIPLDEYRSYSRDKRSAAEKHI